MSVASRVVRLRTLQGRSQRDLAQSSGLAQSTIAGIERGRRGRRWDHLTLHRLAVSLGLPGVDELLVGSLVEVRWALEVGDEAMAIRALRDLLSDCQEQGRSRHALFFLESLDRTVLSWWPATLIVLAVESSSWLAGHESWRSFVRLAYQRLVELHGQAAADLLIPDPPPPAEKTCETLSQDRSFV